MKKRRRGVAALLLITTSILPVTAADIVGRVIDKSNKQPLLGATVYIDGTQNGTITNTNGVFMLSGLQETKYAVFIKYLSYKTQKIEGVQAFSSTDKDTLTIQLEPDEQKLNAVTVKGIARKNTETAMISATKSSQVIVSNVSAQEISKTQDNNAGEVIRRVPGISLIDDKFVMVRGLSQRYNNVWINGSAVPSSEADSRAFSFDIIPSSQIDNLTIVKTPSAEYPADYSGGFIMINTKSIPSENDLTISVGGNWNSVTNFKNYEYAKGSSTDFLGFDNGLRSMKGGINSILQSIDNNGTNLLNNGFNNNWYVHNMKPTADLKFNTSFNHHWNINGHNIGMIAAMNYTSEYRTYTDMQNNLYGVYDVANDRSNYLRHSIDDQFNHNVRLGGMLNMTMLSKNGNNKYELKNIFNQLGNDRYTYRKGISAQANQEESAEYYYRSRTTYNGQITGKHTLLHDAFDWSLGYAYANRHVPDRRRYLIDDAIESGVIALSTGNDITREYTQLDEHIFSANFNDKHDFKFNNFEPSLKFGGYGEYRTRKYTTRQFIYNWNTSNNNMPTDFRHADIPTLLSNADNYGADKLYLLEQVNMRNDYSGHNTLGAGYLTASLPFGRLNIYAGARFEYNKMELISNTRDNEISHNSRFYTNNDLFPSINSTYKINEKHQVRMSYGESVNRPEFREVSSSVFYDFDLASSVQGNTELTSCYIQNLDLRYEFYPSKGEIISLAAFYKHFQNPIEWTYTVSGGTDLIYSYTNAHSANNLGLELDIRKDLSFLGLPGFSWSFNGALIHSRVKFPPNSKEENRPMQGQSPYLINTGIFYKNDRHQINCAILYNRIGKRIIGVGRSEGTTGNDDNARIPDSYEMPRNIIDFTASKKIGSHWELKANIRDLIAEKISYEQFANVNYGNGKTQEVQQITRQYKPGRNFGITAIYSF
jgi:TonB-dependent receptor